LLNAGQNAGISLTESFAMMPTSAVSATISPIPEAQYFGVRASGATSSRITPSVAAARSSRRRSGCGRTSATEAVLTYALVLIVGFVAGTVSGIVGTGATIILLPVLVLQFGPREGRADHGDRRPDVELRQDHSWWRRSTGRASAPMRWAASPRQRSGRGPC